MNIFAIFLLLIISVLFLKIKISIYFKFDNFESKIIVKIFGKEIERNGSLVMRKKKYVVKNKITRIFEKKIIKKEDVFSFIKYVEIEKLNIKVSIGALFLFPTIFAVPILATFFESIRRVPFKKLGNYNYSILPIYDKFNLLFEVETIIKIRIIDFIKLFSFKNLLLLRK